MNKQESMENNWIDINLPWKEDFEICYPDYPADVDRKIIDKFGFSIKDHYDGFLKNHDGKSFDFILTEFCDTLYYKGLSDDKECFKMFLESDEKEIVDARQAIDKRNEMVKFRDSLPEIIEWNNICSKLILNKKNSGFCYSELCRPGVLIEVNNNGEVQQYLIGHINKHAGLCGYTMAFNDNTIVLRAKILINKDWL